MQALLERADAQYRVVMVAGEGTKVAIGDQDPATATIDVQTTVKDFQVAEDAAPAALVAMLVTLIKQQGPELTALIKALLDDDGEEVVDDSDDDNDDKPTTVEEDDE